jgi:putative addiction module antidote
MLYILYNGVNAMNEHSKVAADARGQVIGTVEIKKIGNSLGIILSKDVLARMHVGVGDKLYATLTPDGGFRLTPYDPDFEKAMEVARRGMKRYHNALAELAK